MQSVYYTPGHAQMPRFVSLLRAVNVGKGKRVSMGECKAMLVGPGYTEVSTLVNSGNAVFTSVGRSCWRL